jgi:hypothetical protein
LHRFNESSYTVPKTVLSGTLRCDVFGRCDPMAYQLQILWVYGTR